MSIADVAAVITNGANTFLSNGTTAFITGPAILLSNAPKKHQIEFFWIVVS